MKCFMTGFVAALLMLVAAQAWSTERWTIRERYVPPQPSLGPESGPKQWEVESNLGRRGTIRRYQDSSFGVGEPDRYRYEIEVDRGYGPGEPGYVPGWD